MAWEKSGVLFLVSFLTLWCSPVWAQYGGGQGTTCDPYLIENLDHLVTLMQTPEDWSGCFKLMADIDWDTTVTDLRIGTGYYSSFTGVFDGNGHVISGFIYDQSKDYAGLFGRVNSSGVVKNLGLEQAWVQGDDDVGLLVGRHLGTIQNCYTTGTVSGDSDVGGLVGEASSGTIVWSYSHANVTGHSYVGGLLGYGYSATLVHCYSTGRVLPDNDSTTSLGGMVGYCSGTVTSSFWDVETSGMSTSARGTGVTTTEMQSITTFQAAGWGFCEGEVRGRWVMPAGVGTPLLWWQDEQWNQPVSFSAGLGSVEDPYLLVSPEDLAQIGGRPELLNCCFRLECDLDLQGMTVQSIGNLYEPFVGDFDGNGHELSNLEMLDATQGPQGLFGVVGAAGTIHDLGCIEISVQGENVCGGLVGFNEGLIERCYTKGVVNGIYSVGGLVGSNTGLITQCFSTVDVNGTSARSGGLVGYNRGEIEACYAQGQVVNTLNVGGLVGRNYGGRIANCYATGEVAGEQSIGGLCGACTGTVRHCFWDTQTSGLMTGAAAQGLSTVDLQCNETFIHWNSDDAAVWILDEGHDYPRLSWQGTAGEPIPVYTIADFIPGSGWQDDPYVIETVEQLNVVGRFPETWEGVFVLAADVNLVESGDRDFSRIGWSYDESFNGVFDGRGHTVYGLNHSYVDQDEKGMFGYIGREAWVKNLTLEDVVSWADGSSKIGGLAGVNAGVVVNCHVVSGTVGGESYAGGLVGANGGTIVNSTAWAEIEVQTYGGGLVGHNSGTIMLSSAQGTLRGSDSGGLVGWDRDGRISNCYAQVSLPETDSCGGLVGSSMFSLLVNCYSVGSFDMGGLVAEIGRDVLSRGCFWDVESSGVSERAVGVGATTEEMWDVNLYDGAHWDIALASSDVNATWIMPDEGGYPVLNTGWLSSDPYYAFSGGQGTAEDPFLLTNPCDLLALGVMPMTVGRYFRLGDFIDLTGVDYLDQGNPFMGVLDGDGYAIRGFSFSDSIDVVGLFTCIGPWGEVYDLGVTQLNIQADDYVGGLAGANWGILDWCYTAGMIQGDNEVNGLVGWEQGETTNCLSFVEIPIFQDDELQDDESETESSTSGGRR